MFLALTALMLQIATVPQPLALSDATAAIAVATKASVASAKIEGASETDSVVASDSASEELATETSANHESSLDPESQPEPAVAYTPGRLTLEPVTPAAFRPIKQQPVLAPADDGSRRRLWLGLSIAQHSAAAFDAWSTRRVIASGAGQELNPMLRPFAGNASLYAAVQVAPALLDYVSHRMMYSEHAWARRTWWVPQALGTAMSLVSGVHNLGVYSAH